MVIAILAAIYVLVIAFVAGLITAWLEEVGWHESASFIGGLVAGLLWPATLAIFDCIWVTKALFVILSAVWRLGYRAL